MANWSRCFIAIALAIRLAGPPSSCLQAAETKESEEVAILQLKILEGDGAVHQPGSRSSLPLTVQVTDETGQPVEGATVTFRMPSSGPTGIFASGLSTEVLTTDSKGRASVWKIRWGRQDGPAQIRITAIKSKARAGTVSSQFIDATPPAADGQDNRSSRSVSKPRGKWIALAVAVAGAAAGGLALGLSGKSSNSPATASVTKTPGVQVGTPSITVGKP